jgi:type IV pilus assembly protein PilA
MWLQYCKTGRPSFGFPFVMQLRRRPGLGYTLVELMVVVVVLGVLAAVAIPAFITYIRRAKTSEASDKVSLLTRNSVAYYIDANTAVGRGVSGTAVTLMFPVDEPETPTASCCDNADLRCVTPPDDWDAPTWMALQFAVTDPHYYRYAYDSSGAGPGSLFTARAVGDLDCDGIFSTFERAGISLTSGTVFSSRGVYRHLEAE